MVRSVLSAVLFLILIAAHPLHVSVCEIDFDTDRKALEITQRVFSDDLELELRKETGREDLDIFEGISSKERDDLFESYLQRHLSISLEGKKRNFEYLGHELENDAFFMYIQIVNVDELQLISVKNDILLNYYDDQMNIVHISEKDKVKSMRLMRRKPSDQINF